MEHLVLKLSRFGNTADDSIYGTDKVGSQITGGVNIVGASLKENLSGPRQGVGYAYGSPSGSASAAVRAGDVTACNVRFSLDWFY